MTECEKQDFAISMRGTGICEAKEEKRIFDLSTLTPQEALDAPSFVEGTTSCGVCMCSSTNVEMNKEEKYDKEL